MAKINSIHKIDLSTVDEFPVYLLLGSQTSRYKVIGSLALKDDIAINPSGTPKEGMVVTIDYQAEVTTTVEVSRFGDYSFTIFDTKVPYSWLNKKLKVWCEYLNAAWSVYILPSIDSIPNIKLESLDPGIVDGTTLSVDGTTGKFIIKLLGVGAAQLAADAVESDKIKAKAVTLAKMADLTRGYVIVGNSTGAPAALNAKTDKGLLMGNGTDLISVTPHGDSDITWTSGGLFSVLADKILAAMIKAGELVNAHLSATAAIVFTKMAALTASKIPVINSSGFIEAGSVDASKLAYINVTTPGVAEVSKAVVLSGAGKIDTLDVTTLKINGVTLTASGTELNYVKDSTGTLQTQIDNALGAKGVTTITGNTTATFANLRSTYLANTGAGAIVLTLPVANTVPAGTPVRLHRVGANDASFAAQGTDKLYPATSYSADVATVACSATGKSIVAVCDGVSSWQVVTVE